MVLRQVNEEGGVFLGESYIVWENGFKAGRGFSRWESCCFKGRGLLSSY